MNAIVPFSFESTQIRSIIQDGEPWFVGADVCSALGLGNAPMALSRLDLDEKGVSSVDTLGGKQSSTIINEPGVYRLIFTSRRPEAERFKRWLAHEVLPEIRRTGQYHSQSPTRRRIPAPLLSSAFAAFNSRNKLSDWSEYVPFDHLERAFPVARKGQIKAVMVYLGFLPQLLPYMGDAFAFVRYTMPSDIKGNNAQPVRWMFDDKGRWRADVERLLELHRPKIDSPSIIP